MRLQADGLLVHRADACDTLVLALQPEVPAQRLDLKGEIREACGARHTGKPAVPPPIPDQLGTPSLFPDRAAAPHRTFTRLMNACTSGEGAQPKAKHRIVQYAEAQGVEVFKQRLDVPDAAVAALVEAALEGLETSRAR